MTHRWILAGLVLASILGVTALADALFTSDEERLEEVATAVIDGDEGARLDALLSYADLEREPVAIGGRRVRSDRDLADALEEELGRLDDGTLEVVETRARVIGETGRLAMRIRADGELVDAEVVMVRDGQGWLLSGARRL